MAPNLLFPPALRADTAADIQEEPDKAIPPVPAFLTDLPLSRGRLHKTADYTAGFSTVLMSPGSAGDPMFLPVSAARRLFQKQSCPESDHSVLPFGKKQQSFVPRAAPLLRYRPVPDIRSA